MKDFKTLAAWMNACNKLDLVIYRKQPLSGNETDDYHAYDDNNCMLDRAYFGHHSEPMSCYGFISESVTEFADDVLTAFMLPSV